MSLFWEHGYEGVTQQQMATATGLSTSSLYNSFGTKVEAFREVVAEYLRQMQAVTEPLEQGVRGREDVLEALSRLEVALGGKNVGFGCLATTAMVRPVDDQVVAATLSYREQLRSGFTAAVGRARALGETTAEPDVLARMLTAAVLGMLVIARADKNGAEIADQLQAARRFVGTF